MSTKIEGIGNDVVETSTPVKEWLVTYVGEQHGPGSGDVTVEMIVDTLSEEFPEFLIHVAEENWIRGYEQALNDVDTGRKIVEENESAVVKKKSCKLCEE